ncbi:tyrosine-protein phosphatase non-receptor type 14 isoform X2 [Harmonia axyridis]|uniref:tyrosine-protein phosphatase non-receptor type 14 isoform X2 n=1 Tax=Harmonia axyridis TaxID=115357 RepID=UPI001E279936|nr:tyrosine-protein phosphatase non-receptor type 14 isoform X2 [Harmonia axyridis]
MPFKLKLKKSKHYNVVSKTVFVISVEMLDNITVECTLTSESTGQECLEIACQKHGIMQPMFFGLQYISRKKDVPCWLELDKPIKRQLDKYGKNLCVYMRVMYYIVSGVQLLNDETTRYHYFLQLKSDIAEGRIACNPQQAVELAGYCMQAEFGNFDVERHTSNYLKDFQLFPKTFKDPALLESLTEAAIQQHCALNNLPQGIAEEYYICACQKLDGYGQEVYTVKSGRTGEEAIVGVSLIGVGVEYIQAKQSRHFNWSEISNVINHKRDFTIELVGGSEKVEFTFPDIESAKGSWKFCVLQHMFYRQHEIRTLSQNDSENKEVAQPLFQQASSEDMLKQVESYEDITNTRQQWDRPVSTQNLNLRAQSTSCLDLNKQTNDMDHLRSLLPSYRPAPDYETAMQHKYRNSSGAIPSREPMKISNHALLYSSQPEIHQTEAYTTLFRYPDVTHNNIEQRNLASHMFNSNFTRSQILATEQRRNNLAETNGMVHLYKPPPPYPSNKISSNSTPDLACISHPKRFNSIVNNVVSGSSPDLVSTSNFYLKHYGQPMYQQTQPVHRSQSYLPPQHDTYENLATIFNNNNLMGRPSAVIVENPNVTKHIKKVYDEHGNIIYCMPPNMKQILQENQLPSTGFVVTRNQNAMVACDSHLNNSTEPIYENIPLPWQNEGEMRARTQSIHSAPEMSRMMGANEVNQLQGQFQQISIGNCNPDIHIESLYAKVDRNRQQHQQQNAAKPNSSLTNLQDNGLNRSRQELRSSNPRLNASSNDNNSDTMSRTSTFIVNKDSPTSSPSLRNSSYANTSVNSEVTVTDSSMSSNASSKSKKRRWGILIGRSKSTEKVKSATLGREKKKEDKSQSNNKHRWSTGLPRFNPLPPSISKETMCLLLENKLADSQLFFEFDKIPKKKQNADFTTALLNENSAFNRFKDVLPYEDNRPRLLPSKDNKYGYINASHITATVGSKQRFYIAAQGPNRLTLPYFWQCVWEAEVYLIVQLTDLSEELGYLPDAGERCIDVGQDFQVWWEFSQTTGHCVTSKIRLCHVSSRRYRILWHLHYSDWGDQGCPLSVAHFLGFLEEMQSVHQHSMGEIPPGHNKNPPILVHCTAGVGRTGLTILSDLLLYTIDHNQEVCIARVVTLLRYQRAYMVQTIAQYRFVYSLLIHYLKQTRLI